MRLLFVHPFLSSFGGAQLALSWLVKGLARRGHSIKICAGSDSGRCGQELSLIGIQVLLCQDNLPAGKGPGVSMSECIWKESRNVDLIIAGNYPSTLWIHESNLNQQLPVVWNCNEPPRLLYDEIMSAHFLRSSVDPKLHFPWSKWAREKKLRGLIEADQRAVHAINKIIAISRRTATWIETIYGLDASVVPLAIGDMQIQAQGFPPDPFVFLSPAGLEPIKNFETILKAFAFLCRREPRAEARLWMTGSGLWRARAERLARGLGIAGKVEFPGILPRSELLGCYAKCHAVVFVPLDEPFGLVSCEAGCAGKPVIASNHGGPSEIVVNEKTGILVDPLNPEAIAKAMTRLLQGRDLGVQMGKQGQRRMSEEYGVDRYLDDFEKACLLAGQEFPSPK